MYHGSSPLWKHILAGGSVTIYESFPGSMSESALCAASACGATGQSCRLTPRRVLSRLRSPGLTRQLLLQPAAQLRQPPVGPPADSAAPLQPAAELRQPPVGPPADSTDPGAPAAAAELRQPRAQLAAWRPASRLFWSVCGAGPTVGAPSEHVRRSDWLCGGQVRRDARPRHRAPPVAVTGRRRPVRASWCLRFSG